MRGRLPMLAVHALAQPIIGRLIVACAAVSGLALAMPLAGAVMARQSGSYTPVTDVRLRDPSPDDWLMYRRTYNGWGYSPLDQITSQNVGDLTPVWAFRTGVYGEHHQSPPIVNDGTMFVTTGAHVVALDAATGDLVWRYERPLPEDLEKHHPTNRGVGLYEDKVYVGTLDAHVVALDAVSGAVVWERSIADYRLNYYVTMAPLVADGKVMVGTSGGEHGIRGFVVALDAQTGEEVWRRHTIPAPGEPGSETWPGDTWRTGAGPVWLTGHYDPALQLTYWGVGNPGPWMGDTRPGDNLYTNSTIALDVDTGELRGYHQYHWNGSWDWDEANPPLLMDIERSGRTVPALVHVGRNGYIWFLERHTDRISFLEGKPYVYNNVITSLDAVTGRPTYDRAHVPRTGQRVQFCPSLAGGKNWMPESFSPKTRLLYVPASNNFCSFMEGKAVVYTPGGPFGGADFTVFRREGADTFGELQAWNVDTGEEVWTQKFESGNGGSALATGGGLVFLGAIGDRHFRAFDASSGELLWQMKSNSGRVGVPTSYAVDGVQYVAVQIGAQGTRPPLDSVWNPPPREPPPDDGVVWVFAVDCQC